MITAETLIHSNDADLITTLICMEWSASHKPNRFSEFHLELVTVQAEVAKRPSAVALLLKTREKHKQEQKRRQQMAQSDKSLRDGRVLARR